MRIRMLPAAAAAVLAVVLVAGSISGCSPDPAPSPTPTAFASEEEAYAAAEATYRAYIDALNQVDLSDPTTFEPVFALTTGDANAADRESFSQMHADKWTVRGTTRASLIQPRSASATTVELAVCLDVTDVMLTGPTGENVADPDRPDVQSRTIHLVYSVSDPNHIVIDEFSARDGDPSCDS